MITFTLTMYWWTIPTILTALTLGVWWVYSHINDHDIGSLFMLVPALLIISVVWIGAAIFK